LRGRHQDWLVAASDNKQELLDLATLGNIRKQESVLEALSTMPPVQSTGTEYDNNPLLLGVTNGTVDLTTGVLKKSDPKDLITMSTTVPFNPQAACPLFEDFLDQITGKNPKMVEYLKRILGAALFGHTNPQQFWVLKGGGANGKGVLSNVIGNILGDYACTPSRLLYMNTNMGEANSSAPRADLVALYKKRFAHMSEPNAKKGASFNEELLKEHTGQDMIHARDLFSRASDAVDFIPSHSIFFRTNLTPVIENMTTAMIRRLRIIPFRQQFDDNPDGDLTTKLTAEGPGILAMLVRYATLYHHYPEILNDLPAEVMEETAEYIEENDPYSVFIKEECVIEAGATMSHAEAFNRYSAWVDAQNDRELDAGSKTAMGKRLHMVFRKVSTRPTTYSGIRLKDTPAQSTILPESTIQPPWRVHDEQPYWTTD
jgi:putative DNA primase/helicase